MKHVLDNPVWNALTSRNKSLANGNDIAKYFDIEVSPFVAVPDNTPANLEILCQINRFTKPVLLVSNTPISVPKCWQVLNRVDGVQMVYEKSADLDWDSSRIKSLSHEHVAQMLDLTNLTKPGPFASRTIEFGHYRGIFEHEKLVAMAGQRLHVFDFAEVSAVCTHPDFLGKGYARQLLLDQIYRIQKASETPYLHVRSDNVRALQIYEKLGFKTRTEIFFYVLMAV
ncbi:GNAT family N-acetyltransferase [Spirosoma daeguense]